jgi:hypothetical protein
VDNDKVDKRKGIPLTISFACLCATAPECFILLWLRDCKEVW